MSSHGVKQDWETKEKIIRTDTLSCLWQLGETDVLLPQNNFSDCHCTLQHGFVACQSCTCHMFLLVLLATVNTLSGCLLKLMSVFFVVFTCGVTLWLYASVYTACVGDACGVLRNLPLVILWSRVSEYLYAIYSRGSHHNNHEPSAVSVGHLQGQFVNFLKFWPTWCSSASKLLDWLNAHLRKSQSKFDPLIIPEEGPNGPKQC